MRLINRKSAAILGCTAIAVSLALSMTGESTAETQAPSPEASTQRTAVQKVSVNVDRTKAETAPRSHTARDRTGTGAIYADREDKLTEFSNWVGREIGRATGLTDLPDPPRSGNEILEHAIRNKGAKDAEKTIEFFSKPAPSGPDPHPTPNPNAPATPKGTAPASTPAPHPTPSERDPGGSHGGHDPLDAGPGETNDAPRDVRDRVGRIARTEITNHARHRDRAQRLPCS